MKIETKETRIGSYELEIPIDADRKRVWKALTEEINFWWLPDFHMTGEGSIVTLDVRAGGHLLEVHEDGSSLMWSTVHMCQPEKSLDLVGHIGAEWGGPNTDMMHLSLEERDGGTVLHVHASMFGNVDEANLKSLEDGWRQLFTDGLKRHAESK